MTEIGVADIRANLADVINRVAYGGERIVLQRRGKRVLAVVPMEDLALIEELEDRADILAAKKARKEKGEIPLDAVKARLRMK
jgi:prevent-host-death family protein